MQLFEQVFKKFSKTYKLKIIEKALFQVVQEGKIDHSCANM